MRANTKTSGAKFTFDTEFVAGDERRTAEAERRRKKTLSIEEIETLQAEAHAEGRNDAAARNAEATERALAALGLAIRAAVGEAQAEIEQVRAEAAAIALAAARKLAPAAIAALPAGDVEAALRSAMHQAIGEPRVTLRAAPAVVEVLEARLADIAHEEGYEGRVAVAADPAMMGADCRIEWRGGGAERREQAIEDALTALIAHRFSHQVKG